MNISYEETEVATIAIDEAKILVIKAKITTYSIKFDNVTPACNVGKETHQEVCCSFKGFFLVFLFPSSLCLRRAR